MNMTTDDMSGPSISQTVANALDNVFNKPTPAPVAAPAKPARTRSSKGQGQRGAKIERTWQDLNAKQRRLLTVSTPDPGEHRHPMTIAEMADATGWPSHMAKAKANSHVRNSLRVLVRAGLMEHAKSIGDGTYLVTDLGKREVRKHEADSTERQKKVRKAQRVKRHETSAAPTEATATPAPTATTVAATETKAAE